MLSHSWAFLSLNLPNFLNYCSSLSGSPLALFFFKMALAALGTSGPTWILKSTCLVNFWQNQKTTCWDLDWNFFEWHLHDTECSDPWYTLSFHLLRFPFISFCNILQILILNAQNTRDKMKSLPLWSLHSSGELKKGLSLKSSIWVI